MRCCVCRRELQLQLQRLGAGRLSPQAAMAHASRAMSTNLLLLARRVSKNLRRQHTFDCVCRMFAIPHRRENREGLQNLSEGMRYWELRRCGKLLVSLGSLLRDVPRQRHVVIECDGDQVRWRLDARKD